MLDLPSRRDIPAFLVIKENKNVEDTKVTITGNDYREPLKDRSAVINCLCDIWVDLNTGRDNDEPVDVDNLSHMLTRARDFLCKEWSMDEFGNLTTQPVD
jgi:hypothetical protein